MEGIMNTILCRVNANDILIREDRFGHNSNVFYLYSVKKQKTTKALADFAVIDIDLTVFAIAICKGKLVAVCTMKIWETDQVEEGQKSRGEIMFLATHPDYARQGYAKAVVRAALLYFQGRTQEPTFGLYCDLNEDGIAMEFWKGCGMSLSDDFPDKVYPGNAKATWMTADIAEVLDKLKGSRREACVIDRNAYAAIRCKMRKEKGREFQLRYSYLPGKLNGGWEANGIHNVPTLNGSGDINWTETEPVLRERGITRGDIEEAMDKVGKQVTLKAGAHTRSLAASSELSIFSSGFVAPNQPFGQTDTPAALTSIMEESEAGQKDDFYSDSRDIYTRL